MIRISRRNNDVSLKNEIRFEESFDKSKKTRLAISRKNEKRLTLSLIIIMSGLTLFEIGNMFFKVKNDMDRYKNNQQKMIQSLPDNLIMYSSFDYLQKNNTHYINEDQLLDKEGNIITLENTENPFYLIGIKIDSNLLSNIGLKHSNIKELSFDYSTVRNDCVELLPATLERFSLNKCKFITNLNGLGDSCPNITSISIDGVSALSDLSFIYEMPNLKEIYINESPYITEELISYLRSKGIKTNLNKHHVELTNMVDKIISEIIKPEMTAKERIDATIMYVVKNMSYDMNSLYDSNVTPLSMVLKEKKGVCASYAYFTNVLLNKAGINSYEVHNNIHGWNLIYQDDNYYYLDTTNLDPIISNSNISELTFGTSYYMIDPNDEENLRLMSSPDFKYTRIPLDMINDIQEGKSDTELSETYGINLTYSSMKAYGILSGVITGLALGIAKTRRNNEDILFNDKSIVVEESVKAK